MDVLLQRHCARHIYVVPNGLKELMSDISREVLRSQPDDNVYSFIADYLDALIITRENARVAASVVQSITEITENIGDLLERRGIKRHQAEKIAHLMHNSFKRHIDIRPGMKPSGYTEADVVDEILKKSKLSPGQVEEAAVVIQQAYRQFKEKRDRERELLAGVIDWRVAARSTIYLYRQSGVTVAEANRGATMIKAAYRGFYTRRMMKKIRDEAAMIYDEGTTHSTGGSVDGDVDKDEPPSQAGDSSADQMTMDEESRTGDEEESRYSEASSAVDRSHQSGSYRQKEFPSVPPQEVVGKGGRPESTTALQALFRAASATDASTASEPVERSLPEKGSQRESSEGGSVKPTSVDQDHRAVPEATAEVEDSSSKAAAIDNAVEKGHQTQPTPDAADDIIESTKESTGVEDLTEPIGEEDLGEPTKEPVDEKRTEPVPEEALAESTIDGMVEAMEEDLGEPTKETANEKDLAERTTEPVPEEALAESTIDGMVEATEEDLGEPTKETANERDLAERTTESVPEEALAESTIGDMVEATEIVKHPSGENSAAPVEESKLEEADNNNNGEAIEAIGDQNVADDQETVKPDVAVNEAIPENLASIDEQVDA